MVLEAKYATYLEAKIAEQGFLEDVHSQLNWYEEQAKLHLDRHEQPSDLISVLHLLNTFEMGNEEHESRTKKRNYWIDDMYNTLIYIYRAREHIKNKEFEAAIWCALRVPMYFFGQDAYSGKAARENARNGENRLGSYFKYKKSWYELYKRLKTEEPGLSVNAYAEKIANAHPHQDKKPCRTVVGKEIRKKIREEDRQLGQQV